MRGWLATRFRRHVQTMEDHINLSIIRQSEERGENAPTIHDTYYKAMEKNFLAISTCGRIMCMSGVKKFPNPEINMGLPIHPIYLLAYHPQGSNMIRKWAKEKPSRRDQADAKRVLMSEMSKPDKLKITSEKHNLVLLFRRLESGRVICIDTNMGKMLVGGVGIAHIDMNNANNKLENLRMVCLREAINMLRNFEDDGGCSNDYLYIEESWPVKIETTIVTPRATPPPQVHGSPTNKG